MVLISSSNPDGKSSTYNNLFFWRIENSNDRGIIFDKDFNVYYRGIIHTENNDPSTAYIYIINYNLNSSRKVVISEMKMLSETSIDIKDEKIKIISVPKSARAQIVEIIPFYDNDFDTNSVIEEVIITSCPFDIPIPKHCLGNEFVIWIDNMCKKFTL